MPADDYTISEPAAMSKDSAACGKGLLPPDITTPLPPAEVVARLDQASRRGRLPGFERLPPEAGLFKLELHGKPFDGVMIARAEEDSAGTRLKLDARMLPQLPLIFAMILISTVWPGVYFMDQLIPGEWGWIPTWWWYIPVTALPLPFAWRVLMRRAREALVTAMHEGVEKVVKELDGRIEA